MRLKLFIGILASIVGPSLGPQIACNAAPLPGTTVDGTILILAPDSYTTASAGLGLEGYGIPYQTLIVPKSGVTLPVLNSSPTEGRFGGIITLGGLSYDYDGVFQSAITTQQWDALDQYQEDFRVRMVRLDEFPGTDFGTSLAGNGGCCETGVEQLISFTDTTDFATARIKSGAGLTTQGLWHYPAVIDTPATTKQIAEFAPGGSFSTDTTAAVINTFGDREQMVFFTSWAAEWSVTSAFLQHAFIHWMTRGLFLGKRKTLLGAQVDDLQLESELYLPAGEIFKIRTADLDAHVTWQTNINQRLPAGSDFWLEMAHNGNGDIISAIEEPTGEDICVPPEAVDYPFPPETALDFKKPPGSGTDLWPAYFQEYDWTFACAALDDFANWFLDDGNLNAFAHLSHTFTHLPLNNVTYSDASREIQFNQDWMTQMGIDQATRFSPQGLVPPAITGLSNADAIQAWLDNGIRYVVGDNTRPNLRNPANKHWPLETTAATNGYDGLIIIPRYPTTIYYNCDTPECTLQEWIDTSGGSGDFANLLDDARSTNTRYLLGLQGDPYMFHQANMRQIDVEPITVGSQTGKMSLVMIWVETIVQELTRLTDWPIVSLKHDDIARYFIDRMTLDGCGPALAYAYADDGLSVQSVTVTTEGNACEVPVPVTIPAGSTVASGGSQSVDQVGDEPTIVWVTMGGSPVTLTLSQAVDL